MNEVMVGIEVIVRSKVKVKDNVMVRIKFFSGLKS
jgi:hypothetical protein